jgi:ribosomal protein L10
MIHIVFNEPDSDVLGNAIEMDETMAGEIKIIRDDYAVGPLQDINTPDGAAARKDWWKMVLEGGDYAGMVEEGKVNDEKVLLDIIETLTNDENEAVWIWAAQNKHDVCGYYWLVSQLLAFQGRVHILYLNNLPFINEKGNIFYPEWLSQIPSKEFLKAKKLARPVTTSEFEVDGDEWNKICAQGSMVRLLEGGKKILHKEISYYDTDLSRFIMADAQKASKIIHSFLSKNKETTGDAFLLWRLKNMIQQNDKYEVVGKLGAMKDFEIKKKSTVQTTE